MMRRCELFSDTYALGRGGFAGTLTGPAEAGCGYE